MGTSSPISPPPLDGSKPRIRTILSGLRHLNTRISESASEWRKIRWDQPLRPDPSIWRLVRGLRCVLDVARGLSRHIAFITSSLLVTGGVIFFLFLTYKFYARYIRRVCNLSVDVCCYWSSSTNIHCSNMSVSCLSGAFRNGPPVHDPRRGLVLSISNSLGRLCSDLR